MVVPNSQSAGKHTCTVGFALFLIPGLGLPKLKRCDYTCRWLPWWGSGGFWRRK